MHSIDARVDIDHPSAIPWSTSPTVSPRLGQGIQASVSKDAQNTTTLPQLSSTILGGKTQLSTEGAMMNSSVANSITHLPNLAASNNSALNVGRTGPRRIGEPAVSGVAASSSSMPIPTTSIVFQQHMAMSPRGYPSRLQTSANGTLTHAEWTRMRTAAVKQHHADLERMSTPFLEHLRRVKVRATALHSLLQEETDRAESQRQRRLERILTSSQSASGTAAEHEPGEEQLIAMGDDAARDRINSPQLSPLSVAIARSGALNDPVGHEHHVRVTISPPLSNASHHPHPPAASARSHRPLKLRSVSPSRKPRGHIPELSDDAPQWLRRLHEVLQ